MIVSIICKEKVMSYKKRPTKDDLFERIAHLEKHNRELSDELEKERRHQWELKIPEATEKMEEFLREKFPCTWCKLRFEHVDAAAYWYTFELLNDDRRQTWCVRHSDLGEM
jgi:hypothetical protein